MRITPVDINKQEFKKSMRGYDPVEVDTFLEMLGHEFEVLINENKDLQKKVIQLETELKNFKEVEKTLKQTLMSMEESSKKSIENSAKEAGLIKKEAELAAAEMLETARRETHKLNEEMANLRSQKESLIARLRHILSAHLELLDVLEVDDSEIQKLKDRTKKQFSGKRNTTAVKGDSRPPQQAAPAPKKAEQPPQVNPQKPVVTPEKNNPDKENLHGPDLFKDIFGDDATSDDFTKE